MTKNPPRLLQSRHRNLVEQTSQSAAMFTWKFFTRIQTIIEWEVELYQAASVFKCWKKTLNFNWTKSEYTDRPSNINFTIRFDQLKFEIENESGNVAKFDIYMYGELWHDSDKDGIPGPSAMESLYDVIKKILF